MLRHRFLWLACITLLAFPLSLRAQTTTGTVRGYVKDQNGAPVADAEVQARQTETGIVRSTVSRTDGSYIIPGLVPAEYELSVRKIGYTPQRRPITAQIGATEAQLAVLEAAYRSQMAFGELEDAYRRPLEGAESRLPDAGRKS